MRLGAKQELFSRLLVQLIARAHATGHEVRLGHVYRTDPRHKPRCHALKIAADLNLFKDGRFLTTTKAHRELGQWWEKQHELCRWGGRFRPMDGNHYSLTHDGYS